MKKSTIILGENEKMVQWFITDISDIKKEIIYVTSDKESLESQYNTQNPWWIHCGVDVYQCNPESIRDAGVIKKYVAELCRLIEMKTYGETQVVHFWEDERVAWYSMTQLIETSLISGHFANESNAIYIDVFSCKYYDPDIVARFTTDFFEGENYKLSINLRM